ncbi:MAG: aminofutalosine synthase MqnE [Candidatus Omnitrophica bacterium]|nr:aminofutalosine synthase MqnE [Candidatus Omnitrophota bacterium]
MSRLLDATARTLDAGGRLTREEGVALFAEEDLLGLGALADRVKQRRWQHRGHFVLNRQINPSNLCVLSCRFCDFASKRGRSDAYEMTMEEILAKCDGVREVHIVGGLHPSWSFDYFCEMLAAIKRRHPQIQIKAFTAVEIDYFSKKARLTIEQVLLRLQAVGLVALPGGGAEVFSERVRKQLFPFKMGAPRWLEIHRIAHRLGIPSNSTLLYGHMETHEERVDHMLKLRELQDETHGFLSFIPLAYQPGKTKVVTRQASAIEDLKTIAIARLLLDNFPHIKAYWVTMGEETASVALRFGADDIDGTIGEERIMHAAEADSPLAMGRERLIQLIREAGCVPVERDALYHEVQVYDSDVEQVAEPVPA